MRMQYDPFPFVFACGDLPAKLACLEFFGLADSPGGRDCVLSLVASQRSDGAFPSNLEASNWGTRETATNTLLLCRASLTPYGVNLTCAVDFLMEHQQPDGGWAENPSLPIPEQMVELSNQCSVTWITANIVELLRQMGLGECRECQAAVEWLTTMQGQHGGWPMFAGDIGEQLSTKGDPDSTAQITFLMRRIYGECHRAYLRGRELLDSYFDQCAHDAKRGYRIRLRDGRRESVGVYELTHLLLSSLVDPPDRPRSGYDVTDPRVKQMMETLINAQRPDGGWRPFWAEESDPVYTVLAVETLVLTRMVPREALQPRIILHTGL
jgi:hypothetical protein